MKKHFFCLLLSLMLLLGCAIKDGVARDGWKTGMINVEPGQKEYRLFALDSASGKPLIRALTTRG